MVLGGSLSSGWGNVSSQGRSFYRFLGIFLFFGGKEIYTLARHLRTWKVKSIFIYSGFFIRNLKPRVVIFTTEYLCLLGALGNVCRHRLVVTIKVGGVTTGISWVETREAAEHPALPAKDNIMQPIVSGGGETLSAPRSGCPGPSLVIMGERP